MKKRDKSPWVDICKYQGPKGWCIACGLTSKESKGWKAMKPFAKKALLSQLQRRQAELNSLKLKVD